MTKIYIKNNIRIYVSDFTEVAKKAIELQKTKPFPSLILATAVAVLGPLAFLLNAKDGKTSAMIKGSGSIKNIIVESNGEGEVRALVGNPEIETEYDEKDFNTIPLILGIGDSGTLKIVNTTSTNQFGGEVVLANADIITDLAYYFDLSEQIKTAIRSSVYFKDKDNLERAYSVIMQLLPGHKEEDIEWIQNFIKTNNLDEMSLEEYVQKIDGSLVGEKSLMWKCWCSKEKTFAAVKLLEQKDIQDILNKEGKIEVHCHFCNLNYHFYENDFNFKKENNEK